MIREVVWETNKWRDDVIGTDEKRLELQVLKRILRRENKMGVDLMSEAGGSFMVNWYGWKRLFNLACRYGWEPQGTIDPDASYKDDPEYDPEHVKNWDGGYFSNDEQLVNVEDAKEMAKAIEKYLSQPHIREGGTMELFFDETIYESAGDLKEAIGEAFKNCTLQLHSQEGETVEPDFPEEYLRDFINFCRRGGFRIW